MDAEGREDGEVIVSAARNGVGLRAFGVAAGSDLCGITEIFTLDDNDDEEDDEEDDDDGNGESNRFAPVDDVAGILPTTAVAVLVSCCDSA